MATPNYVKFQRGTTEAYNHLKTLNRIDSDTLYFVYDSVEDTHGLLYLGNKLICNNASSTTYGIANLEDVTLGDDLTNNHILIYNGAKWINISTDQLLSSVYSKTEIDEKLKNLSVSGGGLQYKLVDSIDAIDTTATDADKFIYFVPRTTSTNDTYDEYMIVNGAIEKIGSLSVDLTDYVKATELTNYVQKEEGSRLITQAEVAKLEGVEEGAEKNKIVSVESGVFSITEDRELELISIPVTKIEGYSENGPRLITQEEIKKLSQLDLNGNAYVPITVYQAEVGSLTSLTNYDEKNPQTIVSELNSINERLTWGEISTT